LARTWRIDRVFHREKLTSRVIRDQQLLAYVMGLVLFDLFVFFLYFGVRAFGDQPLCDRNRA